tara:strand:- start:1 stop:894 length:894 start_codon:yes stop_codon:yes gene_type:complete
MSFLGSVARIAGTVAPFIAGPVAGTAIATAAGEVAKQEAKKEARKKQQARESEFSSMADFSDFGTGRTPAVVVPPYSPPVATQNAGGGFFSDVSNFFRGAGTVVRDAFSSGIPQLLGVGRPAGIAQQPAITSVTNIGAQESQGSGTIQAGFGSGLGQLVNVGSRLLRSPAGQLGIGTAVGGSLSLMTPDGRQIRITRKTKRLAQQAYQLAMGDLGTATQLFANLSGIGVNEQQYVQILTKRFRNDGAVITKAALRKTRSTIRKMKNMCDMYDDLRPAARRRTPMKRARAASTTLIKN